MGLGAIAGGVAEGVVKGEGLKLQKRLDKREQETHDEQMRKAATEKWAGEALSKIDAYDGDNPDELMSLSTYQAPAAAPAARAPIMKAVDAIRGGLHLGGAQPAAAGAPAAAPAAGATGLAPAGAPVAAAPAAGLKVPLTDAAAGAPAAASAGAEPAAGDATELAGVTVTAAPRKITEADKLLAKSRAMAQAGNFEMAHQYGQEAVKTRVDDSLKELAKSQFSLPRLANYLSEQTDNAYDIEEKNGRIVVTIDGEPAGTYANRGALVGAMKPMIDGDLEGGAKLLMGFTAEDRQERELQSNIEFRKAQQSLDDWYKHQSVGLERQRVGIAGALANNTMANDSISREAATMSLDGVKALRDVVGGKVDPLTGGDIVGVANQMGVMNPQGAFYSVKSVDPDTGEEVTTQRNRYLDIAQGRIAQAQAKFKANPYVGAGLIKLEPIGGGESRYRVKGSDDAYKDFDEAVLVARRLHGNLKPQK